MRLIDADEIENKAVPMDSYDGFWSGTAVKLSVIRKSPTIDAVPVVRCLECKWWKEDDDIGHCDNPDGLDNYAKPDDFCSYGEKRRGKDGTT